MNKKLFYSCAFLLLGSAYSLQAQTQIGSDIKGSSQNELYGNGAIALSSSGDIIAVGSPNNSSGLGKVKIFQNVAGTWTQIADIIGQGTPFATNYQAGKSVALSADGSIVAIGSPYYSGPNWEKTNAGGVRIMKNVSGTWSEIGYILGEVEGENSGDAISLSADGNIIAIGSQFSTAGGVGDQTGQVRVFQNISGVWTPIGEAIKGEASHNNFGRSVALSADGTTLAAGAPFNSNDNGSQTGNVRVFRNISGVWTKINTNINGEPNDFMSGTTVSLSFDGNIVAVGCNRTPCVGCGEPDVNKGAARIYQNIGGQWTQLADIAGEVATDGSGQSVSLSSDGNIVAIGAPGNDGGGENAGQVRIFQNINGTWEQRGSDIEGKEANDLAGSWVALSANGKVVASGAPQNDPNGIVNAGAVRVYDISATINTTLATDTFVLENSRIYPNPVKDNLFINLQQDLNLKQVNVYSVLGQLIKTEKTTVVNVTDLTKGFYLIQIVTDKGNATHKVLVE